MGNMIEKCGLMGISLERGDVSFPIYYGLYALQHRGQESAGIATRDEDGIQLIKDMGLVHEVFNKKNLEKLKGNIGIGHVRYSTTGVSRIENAQPLLVTHRDGNIAIAHNGNLVNAFELRRELEREGRVFHSTSDTEVIAQLLAKELMKHNHDYMRAIEELMRRIRGSYSLVFLLDDTLIAVRDPFGFKPLCIGRTDDSDGEFEEEFHGGNGHIIASETVAMDTLGCSFLRDVTPGEILAIRDGEIVDRERIYQNRCAHCVFEYIYFARVDSVLDGKLVYEVRKKIGERLAEEDTHADADIVMAVPDTGVSFAIGYAKKTGIEYMEGFIKNRFVGRTFIMPDRETREIAVRLKLNVMRKNVEGKRVLLVDDSIVRGTTSRRIVDYLRKKGGAKEVHMRIGCPPIIAPCYLGIDMSTREELIAANNSIEEIRRIINADSLAYLSLDGLISSIGIPEGDLCLGCLTGKYPIEIPGEKCVIKQMRLDQFSNPVPE